MIDRGAEISFLSQYPHEKEVLFAPLTGLEVHSMRVEDAALIVGVNLSVNLTALTIEQVIGKRLKLLTDMANGMSFEVQGQLGPAVGPLAAKVLTRELETTALNKTPETYNVDEHFKEAVNSVLAAKEIVLSENERLRMMERRMEEGECGSASVTLLQAAGAAATDLRVAGTGGAFSVEALVAGGFAIRDLRSKDASGRAAATDVELRAAGVSAKAMSEAGVTAAELRSLGYTCAEVKEGGYTANEAAQAGYAASEARTCGYIATAVEAKEAGWTTGLKKAGFGAKEMKAAGMTLIEAMIAGYMLTELSAVNDKVWTSEVPQVQRQIDELLKKLGASRESVTGTSSLDWSRKGLNDADCTAMLYLAATGALAQLTVSWRSLP